MEISYSQFWSIVVKRALLHYKVPGMIDSLMAKIPMMQTTTFVTSDMRNFGFVGSIPEVMLDKVSTPPFSFVPSDSNIFENIDSFLNLSQTLPPPPLFPTSTSPMTTSILNSSIPTLPTFSIVNSSQPQISIFFSTLIFIELTTSPRTTTIENPTKVSIFKSGKVENRSSCIPGNISNVESNVNIGVSGHIPTSIVDDNLIFGGYPDPIDTFVLPSFTVKVDSDDDDAPMTKGLFKELNQKHDSILLYTETFSTSKWENIMFTHLATFELLTSGNGKVHEET
ncbi:unnamed protein product [Lactuca saligna]|uniref:Uncharacterized protein n=1 Tax=Lactuca saligna TaxID=75948 RepID=A0AA35Z5Y9_LACSI|nr:unnamed protein product [Lactuca saligna]